jgi:hypothetical protein
MTANMQRGEPLEKALGKLVVQKYKKLIFVLYYTTYIKFSVYVLFCRAEYPIPLLRF